MTEELRGRIETAWNEAKACTPTPERSVRVILADADSTLTDALGLLHRIYGSIRAEGEHAMQGRRAAEGHDRRGAHAGRQGRAAAGRGQLHRRGAGGVIWLNT